MSLNRCPGLNQIAIADWYKTENGCNICNICKEHVPDTDIRKTRLPLEHCESYRFINKSDNGIFNFSIWSIDKSSCFPGLENGECLLPISGEFRLLIDGYALKPEQYYRFEIFRNEELIWSTPDKVYYKSTYLSDAFCFLNKPIHMGGCVFGSNDIMIIKLNIFTLKWRDIFLEQGNRGKVITKNQMVFSFHEGQISKTASSEVSGIPLNHSMVQFTTTPLTYNLRLECNNEYGLAKTEEILRKRRMSSLNISERITSRTISDLKEQLQKQLNLFDNIIAEKQSLMPSETLPNPGCSTY